MADKIEIKWLADAEDHDYPAAASYLSMLYEEPVRGKVCRCWVSAIRICSTTARRFSRANRCRPLLLMRAPGNQKVIIADGYHRMCAVYSFDEDALIPCKIV